MNDAKLDKKAGSEDFLLGKIKKICQKHKQIIKVVLFGSRARGDHGERSDYDIALFATSPPSPAFYVELDEVETLLKIDTTLITDGLEPQFLQNIKKEGVVIYQKFEAKYQNFGKAVQRLEEVIKLKDGQDSKLEEIFRDSLTQRFEFCYELAWKTLKEYLIFQGISVESGPRSILKTAYQHNIIDNQEVWLTMIQDQNRSSHEYNEEAVIAIAKRIEESYVQEFVRLREKMQEEMV